MPRDFDEALQAVERALALMERRAVAPTPGNLMAWCAYASGEHPEVVLKLDQLFADGPEVAAEKRAEAVCDLLLSLEECRTLVDSVDGFRSVVGRILQHMGEAAGETSGFGRLLHDSADRLKTATDPDEIRGVVSEVVRRTESMEARCQELEERFQRSSSELVLLRTRLEDVRRQAITDALTGLANRRCFDARLLRWPRKRSWRAATCAS